MMPGGPILEMQGVTKQFEGVSAVAGASFRVAPGSMTALIGPNGAGKTTILDLVSGYVRPDSGSIRLFGRSISRTSPYRIASFGLVRTFQRARVLPGMTVLDNMLLAAPRQAGSHLSALLLRPGLVRRDEALARARAEELLKAFELGTKAAAFAGSLSGGQRKLLEIARALMTEAAILLLDEPLAGVDRALGQRIFDQLDVLRRERGTTFLFIEHDVDTVLSRADEVVVLVQGRVVATGTPAEISARLNTIAAEWTMVGAVL